MVSAISQRSEYNAFNKQVNFHKYTTSECNIYGISVPSFRQKDLFSDCIEKSLDGRGISFPAEYSTAYFNGRSILPSYIQVEVKEIFKTSLFSSSIELKARNDGNLDLKIIENGKSIVIEGNVLTADSLLKALCTSGIKAFKWFNALDYLATNKDVFINLVDPIQHYLQYGAKEHRNPSPFFDEKGYLERNPDVKNALQNGLLSGYKHFIEHGCREGRSPDGFYNEHEYVNAHADLHSLVASGEMECAYFHCIEHGFSEGRVGCADIYDI